MKLEQTAIKKLTIRILTTQMYQIDEIVAKRKLLGLSKHSKRCVVDEIITNGLKSIKK